MNKKLNVNKISVQSFRGIGQERTLDLSKITVIYGENGTGKSSFADAFEYLFSGTLRPLKNRTINNDVIYHKKSSKEDFKIEANFPSKSYLKRDASNELSSKGAISEILDDSYIKNASFILKRRDLLNFIEGTQKDRYDTISKLCGFDDFSKVQQVLSSSSTHLKNKLKEKESDLVKVTEKTSEILVGDTSLDLKECIDEINKLIKETNNNLTVDENSDFDKCADEITFSKKDILIKDHLDKFDRLYNSLNLDIEEEFKNLIMNYEKLAIESFKSSNSLLKVLGASKDYLTSENIDECPVCHSAIDSMEILENLDKEIDDLKNNNSKLDLWKNNVNEFIAKLENIKNDLNKLDESISTLSEFDTVDLAEDITFKSVILETDEMIEILKDLLDFNYDSKIAGYDFAVLEEFKSVKLSFDNYFEKFKQSDDSHKAKKVYDALKSLQNRKELESDIVILRKKAETAEITFNIFKEKKEEFVRNLLLKIIDNVREYYNFIHEGDDISTPDIKISNSNLVDVILNCYGEDVDARSYASEGHLDTLGLCIFLAFNKEFSKIPLIILDDVVSTVDSVHKDKVARLLIDKFEDYQFFITTHNELWANQIKKLVLKESDVKLYEIVDWDVFEGPVLSKPLEPEEKINKYLKGPNKDLFAAGNTARRYLEYILKNICYVNAIKVPYKKQYDVGSLFDYTESECKEFVKGTDLEDYYKKIWEDINRTTDRGNLLSHDNNISIDLSTTDVKGFCEAVINLRKSYTCYYHKKTYLKFDSEKNKFICNTCNSSENMNELGKFDLNVKNFKDNVNSLDYVIGLLGKCNKGITVNKPTARLMIPLIKNQVTSKNIDELNRVILASKIIDKNELKGIFSEEIEKRCNSLSIDENEAIEILIKKNKKLYKLDNKRYLFFDYEGIC